MHSQPAGSRLISSLLDPELSEVWLTKLPRAAVRSKSSGGGRQPRQPPVLIPSPARALQSPQGCGSHARPCPLTRPWTWGGGRGTGPAPRSRNNVIVFQQQFEMKRIIACYAFWNEVMYLVQGHTAMAWPSRDLDLAVCPRPSASSCHLYCHYRDRGSLP